MEAAAAAAPERAATECLAESAAGGESLLRYVTEQSSAKVT